MVAFRDLPFGCADLLFLDKGGRHIFCGPLLRVLGFCRGRRGGWPGPASGGSWEAGRSTAELRRSEAGTMANATAMPCKCQSRQCNCRMARHRGPKFVPGRQGIVASGSSNDEEGCSKRKKESVERLATVNRGWETTVRWNHLGVQTM